MRVRTTSLLCQLTSSLSNESWTFWTDEREGGGRCGDWREGLPSSLAEAARYNGACHMMYKPAKKEDDRAHLVKLR